MVLFVLFRNLIFGYFLLHGLLWWNLHQYAYSPRSLIPRSLMLWAENWYGVTCCESKFDFDFLVSLVLSIPMAIALWFFSRPQYFNTKSHSNAGQLPSKTLIFWSAWAGLHYYLSYSMYEYSGTYPFSLFGVDTRSDQINSAWFEFCCGIFSNRHSIWFCLVMATPATWLLWKLRKPNPHA